MNQRQPSATTVATPNQLLPVNSIPPPTGPGGQMAYAQPPQYAAHPMTVGSMPPMASMGAATGTMPQPGTQTMYGYPAPVAGRPGPPQGMPGGGMQMMVAP
ncbi:hypothetical protein FRC15_000207, partial [Serendipita sp. 397]